MGRMRLMGWAILLLVVAVPATAQEWRPGSESLETIGAGAAVVFTPDLALPGNRAFYEGLGFVYIESADWREALGAIDAANARGAGIRAVILETHGTNGNGLKLQRSKKRRAARSYVSIGALQERLAAAGANEVFVSACNAGRLFRPTIYEELDRTPGDPLFLPPTLGVLDASPSFDSEASPVRIYRRATSHLETLMHGSTRELSAAARAHIEKGRGPQRFVVSTMLVQLLLGDTTLELTDQGWTTEKSRRDFHPDVAEAMFQEMVRFLARAATEKGPVVRALASVP
ncbi:MAG: hypothetical protein ACRD2J_08270 [Thermoanaerobaculia bacterium]